MIIKKYQTFKQFYPFYLSQHQNKICRILHYIGNALALCLLTLGVINQNYVYFIYAFICGYAFAWLGHLFFEKNRPATFTYPLFSFVGDWKMLWDALRKKRL